MAKKKTIDELADEIRHDFDAGDTPDRRAQAVLQQARDAGDGGVRQQDLRVAQRHIAQIDPRREPQIAQRLQAEVLALQGRRGDTQIAHLTPGEVVLPAWAQTPELMNYLAAKAREAGVDPRRFQVGSGKNRINPRTGVLEFADDMDGNAPAPKDDTSLETYGPSWPVDRDREIGHRAHVIYGETSGVYPQPVSPNASPTNPANWDSSSAGQLKQGRQDIGIVSSRNPRVHSGQPDDFKNPIQARAWADSVQAATDSMKASLDPRINRFYLRQEGSDQEVPVYTTLIPPIGPFVNVGGGDVPKGPTTYLDFYTDLKGK